MVRLSNSAISVVAEQDPPGHAANPSLSRLRGITLLEVLIALSIVGLLFAILVPAVQSTRESARRFSCSRNLNQIGIAVSNYETAFGVFPPGSGKGNLSFLGAILPQLDQLPLYNSINFDESLESGNVAVRGTSLPVFACPSDAQAGRHFVKETAGSSYAGNSGSAPQVSGFDGLFFYATPYLPFHDGKLLKSGDVRDGLSNTAAVSEILVGDLSGNRLRTNWNTPESLSEPDQLEDFARLCSSIVQQPGASGLLGERGTPWVYGETGKTFYNHVLTPNSPSCMNGKLVQIGAYTAASQHAGGANVLYADGHVSFIAATIDLMVWREIGSRASRKLHQ